MTLFLRRPAFRWLVPLIAVLAVAGAGLVSTRAAAGPGLPTLTAQQLLTKVAAAKPQSLSGHVQQTSDLGLPSLGGSRGSDDASDLMALLTGSHTMRVAYGAPDQARVSIYSTYGETDLITDGSQSWLWSSADKTVTHTTYPKGSRPDRTRDASAMTPAELASQALDAVGPTTDVTVGKDTTVAGRSAYVLVLTPKASQTGTLVSSVRLAVDGATFTPLSVEVRVKGSEKPAFLSTFTDIAFDAPKASEFTFTAPKGAKVTQKKVTAGKPSDQGMRAGKHGKLQRGKDHSGRYAPQSVVGEGWTAVLLTRTDSKDASGGDPQLQQVLSTLPRVSGAWGSGRLLRGTAFSVVLTDDGRVAAGAVTPQLLYDALG